MQHPSPSRLKALQLIGNQHNINLRGGSGSNFIQQCACDNYKLHTIACHNTSYDYNAEHYSFSKGPGRQVELRPETISSISSLSSCVCSVA